MIKAARAPAGVEAVVVCDLSGSSAGLAHSRSEGNAAAGFQDVLHVHKGSCHQWAREAHGDLVLRNAGRRGLPPAPYSRLCGALDRVCDLLNAGADFAVPLKG